MPDPVEARVRRVGPVRVVVAVGVVPHGPEGDRVQVAHLEPVLVQAVQAQIVDRRIVVAIEGQDAIVAHHAQRLDQAHAGGVDRVAHDVVQSLHGLRVAHPHRHVELVLDSLGQPGDQLTLLREVDRNQVQQRRHRRVHASLPVRVATIDAEGKSTGEVVLKAKDVILATGSRVKSLPGLEPDGKHIVTSDDVLASAHVPASIIVVGAGEGADQVLRTLRASSDSTPTARITRRRPSAGSTSTACSIRRADSFASASSIRGHREPCRSAPRSGRRRRS